MANSFAGPVCCYTNSRDTNPAVLRASIQYQDRGRMEDGAEYLCFTELRLRPGAKVQMHLNTSCNIVFGEWGEFEITACSFGELRDYVRRLVRSFSREF